MADVLRLVAVTLRRGDCVALDAVSVEARAGELLVIEGGRAAGKTSLLEVAGARCRPDSGEVWIAGHDVAGVQAQSLPFVRRNIGYVAAEPRLLAQLSVLENVLLALGPRAEPMSAARAAALRALRAVGLDARTDNQNPAALSAGARRLVALARAIAPAPPLLLLDDPSASFAPADSGLVLSVLLGLVERGASVVCASADPSFVAAATLSGARRLSIEGGRVRPGAAVMAVVSGGGRAAETVRLVTEVARS